MGITIMLTPREAAILLTALGFLKDAVRLMDEFPEDYPAIGGGMEMVTATEIDTLCTRINSSI